MLRYCSLFNQEVMQQHDNFDKLSNRSVLKNIADYLDYTCRLFIKQSNNDAEIIAAASFLRVDPISGRNGSLAPNDRIVLHSRK